jgi:hypothetical protein
MKRRVVRELKYPNREGVSLTSDVKELPLGLPA